MLSPFEWWCRNFILPDICKPCLFVFLRNLFYLTYMIGGNMIYYKRYTGKLLPQKTAEQPSWVQWTHHSEGKTHCEECLMLDGCWFQEENAPSCPHHPYCHCTLDPIPYAVVLMNTTSYSDYSKFDPYLFDPENTYRHGKNRAFESWGYSASDSTWLKNQSEKQALEKYLSGDYMLGKLDRRG